MLMPKSPPVTVAAVVAQHGIPKRTVIAAIERGHLKADKLPGLTGAYVIAQRDLDRWLAKRDAAARTHASPAHVTPPAGVGDEGRGSAGDADPRHLPAVSR